MVEKSHPFNNSTCEESRELRAKGEEQSKRTEGRGERLRTQTEE
jgi:hypothetical protein